jgi:glutaredoxin
LTDRYHGTPSGAEPHVLIIYGTKSSAAYVYLEGELDKRGIAYEKRDLTKDENLRELTDKRARVGKIGGNIALPVAEIDGVLVEGATVEDVAHRMH